MKISKSFWIGLLCGIGGCTQILELDQEYRPGPTGNAGGNANGGAGGAGLSGGSAGAGGSPGCAVDMDCPAPSAPCMGVKCIANACVTNLLPAGAACTPDGQLVCNANGICGECNQPSDCTMLPPDDECQTRSCTSHVCGQSFAAANTKLINQATGDCTDAFCDGTGKTITQPNDMDVPEDNNPCTKNLCANGMPSFPAEPINTTCGVNLKCNDMGQCVGCLMASECAGTDNFCKTRTCNSGMCGFDFTAAGADLPTGQVTGDCKILECDGQGNIVSASNNMDVPVDGKPCTKDVCTGGIPSNPLEPANTPCGPNAFCSAMGVCEKANGTTCANDAECASAHCVEGYCCDATCNQNCKACNIPGSLGTCTTVPVGHADDSCPSPKSCDGSTGANACVAKFPMGYACTQSTQCGSGICVDGVCCSSTCSASCKSCNVAGSVGTCSNLPLGQEDGALCTGTNSCDGMGGCKKDNGQPCSAFGDCASNFCVDGLCCDKACLGTCQACNVVGTVGTCVNVPLGQEDPVATTACTGVSSCNGAGVCLLDNGQPCTMNSECISNNCTGMPKTCQ